jgi:pimeloyl-ACP methyl ester carboxylesterase
MDALGLERVHYLGESIGGIVGILFATRWPERLKTLTICNSPTTLRRAEGETLSGSYGSVSNTLAQEGSRGWGRLLIEQRVISGKSPEHINWVLNEWAKTPTSQGADVDSRALTQPDHISERSNQDALADSERPYRDSRRPGTRNIRRPRRAMYRRISELPEQPELKINGWMNFGPSGLRNHPRL